LSDFSSIKVSQAEIPEKYFALVKKYSNSDDSWVADKDQFGNPIETELNIFYKTEKQIIKHSKELVEDLISIIHIFSCRIDGLRKYKKQIKEDKDV